MAKVRVFLVDDHVTVRQGLRALLSAQADLEVVGEAADGAAAIAAIKPLMPDVVVMDLSMPKMTGAEATRLLRDSLPGVKVLVLTVHEEGAYLRSLLNAGAAGYILKRSAADELVRAVRTVAAGRLYLDPALSDIVVDGLTRRNPATRLGMADLSDREQEVVRLVARGYTNKEVAAKLSVSIKTVETYRARAGEKLGAQSRVDLVRYAMQQGWLDQL